MIMRDIAREPLVHFVALGALLFVVGRESGDGAGPMDARIVVTQGQVAQLASTFAMTWQRPPTAAELEGLIEDRVREEVYYREAVALGLDRDDDVIRRRLRQRMELLSEDLAEQVEPTDQELQAFWEAHRDDYRFGPPHAATQLYFSADDGREVGGAPTLKEVRPMVVRDWKSARRRNVKHELYEEVRSRYTVVVEGLGIEGTDWDRVDGRDSSDGPVGR